jgi:tetratricopeptide (TPR) repeat protein
VRYDVGNLLGGAPSERLRATLAIAFAFVGVACASSNRVTRISAGHRIEGRYIADEAYAAYVSGAVLEAQGRIESARAAYEEAIRHDQESPELWTRVGALRCRTRPDTAAADPWEAFSRAAAIDPSYEEAWTERARCHLQRGELVDAVADATKAVSLDPDRTEPVLVLVNALERRGQLEQAKRWLIGLVTREPGLAEAHEAAQAFASRTGDAALFHASRRALSELRTPGASGAAGDVDDALTRGDFDKARRLAASARLSSGSLALRAAALGKLPFARDQAELVMLADPSNADARVAAIVAADLARDDAALRRALSNLPESFTPLSPLATLLMGEVLRRRIGEDAALAFGATAGSSESDDPLVRAVAARK